jgi:hypothetical protein
MNVNEAYAAITKVARKKTTVAAHLLGVIHSSM